VKMYEEIVFMQGEDAYEAMKILDEKGPEALLEHLLQWDNESCACSENPPWGTGDQVLQHGPFLLRAVSYLEMAYA